MKWFLGIVALYLATLLAAGILVAVNLGRGPASPTPSHVYSSEVIAADYAMTQEMAISGGPGMDARMQSYGMLDRSQDPSYLAALEAYSRQIDRMVGRSP